MTERFDACRIRLGESLTTAMQSLETSSLAIVLVEDATGRLVGTLTDGDVRRALLRGATLLSPVDEYIQRRFTAVSPSAGRAEVLDLMQSLRLSEIPIVDSEQQVVGLHTLPDILGASPRPNIAVVMAGGRGERLRPLTDATPKPMIRVAGRPILEWIVLLLVGFGVRRIYLAVNYLSNQIESHFGNGSVHGCEIAYLRESKALGTAGALSLLPSTPEHPILVMNGDLMTRFDVGAMLLAHERAGASITVGVREYLHAVPFGVIENENGRVRRIQEKPVHAWPTNAGIYVVGPEALSRIPADTVMNMPDLVHQAISNGETVAPFEFVGDWHDVGRPSELSGARGE